MGSDSLRLDTAEIFNWVLQSLICITCSSLWGTKLQACMWEDDMVHCMLRTWLSPARGVRILTPGAKLGGAV